VKVWYRHRKALPNLGDVFREKQPEFQWRTKNLFLIHDNAAAHQLVLVKDFLANSNLTTLEHSPYSPDMALANSYLFPQLKSALKGQPFYFATDITKNATEELKRLSQNCFQECFQQLCSR